MLWQFVQIVEYFASPLNYKLNGNHPRQLVAIYGEKSAAVVSPETALISPIVLVLPRKKSQCTLDTAAADRRISCGILHKR